MTNWVGRNEKSIIRAAFLIPIFSVAAISISHVVSWYDLANPISWAIYLSIAVEIAAMSSIAAASVKIKGFSVWVVFTIVTLIQFIGNIYFCYSEINVDSKSFQDWAELTAPIFESIGSDLSDKIGQRRWLALLEGGLLPLISLTCLHFFIQYGEIDKNKEVVTVEPSTEPEPQIEESSEPLANDDPQYLEQITEPDSDLPDPSVDSKIETVEINETTEKEQTQLVKKTENTALNNPADFAINLVPKKKPELSQALKKLKGK